MSCPLWGSRRAGTQIRPGDPYELSNGHAIHCLGIGGRGSQANLLGGSVLDSDPGVEEAGVDAGYSPSPDTLRAPDVAVGNVPDAPGWIDGAPPLAVEYADTGQDENELATKISELFAAGEELSAPGILQNSVPVEALYDRRAAHEVTLRNLLQRQGYHDLDEVRDEGREEALRAAVLDVLKARDLAVDDTVHAALDGCRDGKTLQLWLTRAATAQAAEEVFTDAAPPRS